MNTIWGFVETQACFVDDLRFAFYLHTDGSFDNVAADRTGVAVNRGVPAGAVSDLQNVHLEVRAIQPGERVRLHQVGLRGILAPGRRGTQNCQGKAAPPYTNSRSHVGFSSRSTFKVALSWYIKSGHFSLILVVHLGPGMDFQITLTDRRDLTRQIYRQMRAAILGGRLRAGQRLPSTRSLATQVSVARKTVTRAYDLLFSESLVTGSPGSGTYVAREIVRSKKYPSSAESVLRPRAVWAHVLDRASAVEPTAPRFDFGVGMPDISLFPFALWRSLVASSGRVLRELDAQYGDPQGDPRLREAIARYVAFTRGVVCDASRIVITHGAQQAFDLIARVLLNPGDVAAVEEPGYPPVRQLWATQGVKVKSVSVDAEGLCVSKLPQNARLVYVTPSHQFPLGMPMSLERKLHLLKWAAEHRACILEDDYDSEFRFDPRPLEALQSLDKRGLVVYVGTFSKVLHPGIRVGFIVAPKSLASALSTARRLTDSHEALVTQAALARFIMEGHLARHVRRMSKVYARRRARLLDLLGRSTEVFGEMVPSVAGLHVACLIKDESRLQPLLRSAMLQGVALTPLSRFSTQSGRSMGFALGYGRISEDQISEALESVDRVG